VHQLVCPFGTRLLLSPAPIKNDRSFCAEFRLAHLLLRTPRMSNIEQSSHHEARPASKTFHEGA